MDSIGLPSINRLAGRYRVLYKLGEGSFAETFLAEDEHLPDAFRCVVKRLKTCSEDSARLQVAKRLFDAEARSLHQLGSHPQIPQLLAHFEEHNEFYLVEEYVEGLSLYQEFETGQKWSEGYVIRLVRDILDVLKFVHEKQVIHRDLKPSNIIRRERDGRIVLIDFGAVKQITTQALDESKIKAHTVIVGTQGYMPGEQLRGCPRLSSDVYAVGMIGIYALTGLNPALGQLEEDEGTAEILWREHASVSAEFAAVLEKMVAYDFRQRYPSAGEALEAINALIRHHQQEDVPTILKMSGVPSATGSGIGSITYRGDTLGGSGSSNGSLKPDVEDSTPQFKADRPSQQNVEIPPNPNVEITPKPYLEEASSAAGTFAVSDVKHPIVRSEVASAPSKPKGSKSKILIASAAAILGLGAIAVLASPNFEPVCKALKNCTENVLSRSTYNDAVALAEAAETDALGAKSIQGLQTAHETLQKAIQQLNGIPKSVQSYQDAQQVLPNYQSRLKGLEEKISIETKAQKELSQATTMANKVLNQKTPPQTKAGLLENKSQLESALTQIRKVPAQTFVASDIKSKQLAYQSKIKSLDQAIAKQEAIEAEQRRQADLAAAAAKPSYNAGTDSGSTGSQPAASDGSQGGTSSGNSSAYNNGGSTYSEPAPAPKAEQPSYSGGSQQAAPPPKAAPQEPLWGSSAPSQQSNGAAPAKGGSEPLW